MAIIPWRGPRLTPLLLAGRVAAEMGRCGSPGRRMPGRLASVRRTAAPEAWMAARLAGVGADCSW